MSDEILKQQKIAAYLGNLLDRVRAIEKFIKNDVNSRNNNAAEAAQTTNPFNNPYVFIPCIVTELPGGNLVTAQQISPTADDGVPWELDSDFTALPLTITVPTNVSLPAEGDTVLAHFTGTFGTSPPTPRYGLFGAGGGSEVTKTIIQSVGDDHLVCRTIVGSVVGTDDILVAKNNKNQRTPWDGLTRNGLTYAYTNNVYRTVTIAASTGFSQIEEIVPRYNVNDVIFAVGTTTAVMTITVGTTPVGVDLVDMNNDNREFVRTGFA